MKRLNNEELELFYRLDEKKYLVSNNPIFDNWLDKLNFSYDKEDIQNFIDKLACWYYVKYPDKQLNSITVYQDSDTDISTEGMTLDSLFNNFNTIELFLLDLSDNKSKKMFCKYLLVLAGYEMIYSKNTTPENGLTRAEFLFADFNQLLNFNLNTDIYNKVLNRDYSLNNSENLILLKTLREKQKKKTVKKKKGLRRILQR